MRSHAVTQTPVAACERSAPCAGRAERGPADRAPAHPAAYARAASVAPATERRAERRDRCQPGDARDGVLDGRRDPVLLLVDARRHHGVWRTDGHRRAHRNGQERRKERAEDVDLAPDAEQKEQRGAAHQRPRAREQAGRSRSASIPNRRESANSTGVAGKVASRAGWRSTRRLLAEQAREEEQDRQGMARSHPRLLDEREHGPAELHEPAADQGPATDATALQAVPIARLGPRVEPRARAPPWSTHGRAGRPPAAAPPRRHVMPSERRTRVSSWGTRARPGRAGVTVAAEPHRRGHAARHPPRRALRAGRCRSVPGDPRAKTPGGRPRGSSGAGRRARWERRGP